MTRPYLISAIVQIHAREASAAQRLRSNGVRGPEADFGGTRATRRPLYGPVDSLWSPRHPGRLGFLTFGHYLDFAPY